MTGPIPARVELRDREKGRWTALPPSRIPQWFPHLIVVQYGRSTHRPSDEAWLKRRVKSDNRYMARLDDAGEVDAEIDVCLRCMMRVAYKSRSGISRPPMSTHGGAR